MRTWLVCVLLLCFSLHLRAEPLAPARVPEPLQPWIDWVLFDAPDYPCPFPFDHFDDKRCIWPSRLTLKLDARQGQFTLVGKAFAPGWVLLPGDARHWPQDVRAAEQPAVVVAQQGQPASYVAAGEYRLQGTWTWQTLPESLALPPETGLIELDVAGEKVAAPVFKQGRLWIRHSAAPITAAREEDRLELQVFRRIIDDVPLQVVTRLVLDVAGRTREIELPQALLDGFIALRLDSALPARFENGTLRLQLRPGHWQVEVLARHARPLDALTLPARPAPWPDSELWAFDARPALRLVEVEQVTAVDPSQTNLPAEWQQLPAYRVHAGETMQWRVIRRGDPDPEPNQLSLQRQLWLDFDGAGYSVADLIHGTMTRDWRLEAQDGWHVGRVSLDGVGQVITRLTPAHPPGVEVRQGRVALAADSRITSRSPTLPVAGWHSDFQHVSAQLYLPPGWRLLATRGVDNVPTSWLARWTLLDLFLLLIASLATARLWSWRWGGVALVTLGLLWQESGAPTWVWLHVLAATALLRVLPAGKVAYWVERYRYVCGVVLLLSALPFSVAQIRTALYPQLEQPYHWAAPMSQTAAVSAELGAPPAALMVAPDEHAAGMERMTKMRSFHSDAARITATPESAAPSFERIDPDARVPTGPGLPTWQWSQVALSWNGPVTAQQTMTLWLISPPMLAVIKVLQVVLWVLLALRLFDLPLPHGPGGWRRAAAKAVGAAQDGPANAPLHMGSSPQGVLLLVLCGGALSGLSPGPAVAAPPATAFPDEALLQRLRERLLQAPECLPECAQLAQLHLAAQGAALTVTLEAHAQQRTALPLPAHPEQWEPQRILVDDAPVPVLARDAAGGLWLALEPGRHVVQLSGSSAGRQQIVLPLPMTPRRVTFALEGWHLEGVHDDGVAEAQIRLTRHDTAPTTQPENALPPSVLSGFARVERTVSLGLDWRVRTQVMRLSPSDGPWLVKIPLLAGEAVTTPGIRVHEREAEIHFAAGQTLLAWESVLERRDTLDLQATDTTQWHEVWRVEVGPMWHLTSDGLTVMHHRDAQQRWLPEWRPWPGERVVWHISRPAPLAGQTLTIDRSQLTQTPGARAQALRLELTLRSSQADQHTLHLPEHAQLQSVTLDGVAQPIRLQQHGQLVLPVRPGTQQVQIVWREDQALPWRLLTPAVDLGVDSVNAQFTLHLPEDRWLLWVHGPRLGPALLFWGVVLALIVCALLLGAWRITPLRAPQWFLLFIGLSQLPVEAALIVSGWLVALGYRARRPFANAARFNAGQVLLAGWTLLALALLFTAVEQGLLGRPEMQIAGNHSTAQALHWYQDRSGPRLPQAGVVSVPLWGYRLAMLAWSLWLANALLHWLKWGWRCVSSEGLWRKTTKTVAPPPVEEKTSAAAAVKEDPWKE